VLVERFAAANAEDEPPPALDGGGRSGLGDDSGMDPRRRKVTAVAMCSDVTSEGAPMTSHTNGLWPCSSFRDGNDRRSTGLQANSFSLFGLLNQLYRALSHSPLMSSISWYPDTVTCQRMSTPSRPVLEFRHELIVGHGEAYL
jgi:hypothetical protein